MSKKFEITDFEISDDLQGVIINFTLDGVPHVLAHQCGLNVDGQPFDFMHMSYILPDCKDWLDDYDLDNGYPPDFMPDSEEDEKGDTISDIIDSVVLLDGYDSEDVWHNKSQYYKDKECEYHDIDDAAQLMDDDIREDVHKDLAPCTAQEFIEEYARRHKEKYGEEFAPWAGGAW